MGFLRKLAGLFVERVPVDDQGRPVKPVPTPRGVPTPPAQQPGGQPGAPTQQPMPGAPMPMSGSMPVQPMPIQPSQPGTPVQPGTQGGVPVQPNPPMAGNVAAPVTIAVALRAVVPQEYAAHLAPHGLHVIAAGPDITSEQARGWGAQVLVVSAECLGQDLHLLQRPQLATVFIAPQAVMLPAHPGVVQVQEPLHASDVAHAVREAAAGWAATAPPSHG